jgi:hypothetical protein
MVIGTCCIGSYKSEKILQKYVIYSYDQITMPCLKTETGNRRLNIVKTFVAMKDYLKKKNIFKE